MFYAESIYLFYWKQDPGIISTFQELYLRNILTTVSLHSEKWGSTVIKFPKVVCNSRRKIVGNKENHDVNTD